MSLRRKIVATVALALLAAVAYFGYRIVHTVRQIPEAYAAWDTGTLVIEYMKSHHNRWPSSWEDLLSVMSSSSGEQIMLRGAGAGDTNYATSLRSKVAIDWKFDPRCPVQACPITQVDGSRFPVVWRGAEPNEMVRIYLASSNTNSL